MINLHAAKLRDLIGNRSARVGVVGLGYVGLPLLVEFASRGYTAVAYSSRAREGLSVAMPVTWTDIEAGIPPQAFTLGGKRQR